MKAKEKAINALLAAIEQGIVTKSTKERLISLETQKEELESKISLEKARQIKPLEVDKVKAFLTYFARKKYENGQEKNEFFNSFINRVILYDDKILIFYNTGENTPTVIKRKDTEELISHFNDLAANGKNATNDCPNATGNNSLIVQNKNSLEPQGFKRVALGGGEGIRTPVGLHPNGFQDRLVMTASIRLRDCGAFALPSYYIPFYLKNQPFGISFSFFALKSLCKIRLCAKMFYI